MKNLARAIAVAGLIGTPAFAADMPVKASSPAPAPVYNWTGWYAGVNAGASFGNVKTDFNVPFTGSTTQDNQPTGSFSGNGFASGRAYPDGFIGGGQIGYNWQVSPIWVVGLEADIQGALEKDSNTATVFTSGQETTNFFGNVTGSTVANYQTKIDWFGTARLRAGYVWGNGNVFSYLTGGLAYGKVDIEGTSATTGLVGTTSYGTINSAFSNSHVNTGWVLGYGTEGVIDFWGARNWTWKVEGLYMDLGHLDATGPGGTASFTIGPNHETIHGTIGQVATHSHFTDGILRGGLNYKFN